MRYAHVSVRKKMYNKTAQLTKTDETRPSCNRCKKSGLQCRGYERKTQFVDETQWTRDKHEASAITLPRRSTTGQHSSSALWSSADLAKKLDPLVMRFLRGAFASLSVDFTSWHYSPADGAVVRRPYLPVSLAKRSVRTLRIANPYSSTA